MIEHRYSTRLLFGRYPFLARCIVAVPTVTRQWHRLPKRNRDVSLFPIRRWLSDNCVGAYRTMASWKVDGRADLFSHRCILTAYFEKRQDYEAFLSSESSEIVGTSCPASDEQEQLIRQGILIDIRDRLYYNKFRYRLNFRGGWNKNRRFLTESIRKQFHDPSKTKQDYMMATYDCTLYLREESDMMMARLSLGEYIRRTTVVYTADELSNG